MTRDELLIKVGQIQIYSVLANTYGAESAIKNAQKYVDDVLSEFDRLEAIEEARRWIPVSERLPEDNQWVIMWNDLLDVAREGRHFSKDGMHQWESASGIFYNDDSHYNHITHWQPLPEAPNEIHD